MHEANDEEALEYSNDSLQGPLATKPTAATSIGRCRPAPPIVEKKAAACGGHHQFWGDRVLPLHLND